MIPGAPEGSVDLGADLSVKSFGAPAVGFAVRHAPVPHTTVTDGEPIPCVHADGICYEVEAGAFTGTLTGKTCRHCGRVFD